MSGGGGPAGRDFDDLPSDPLVSVVRDVLRDETIDTEFRRQLRDRLVTEAGQRAAADDSGAADRRNRRWLVPRLVVPVAAALIAILLAVMVAALRHGGGSSVLVSASSPVQGSLSVDPGSSVVVRFSRAMDHLSVEAALRIEPAVAVRTSWAGDDLTVTAAHGLAPNMGYLLAFDRSRARTVSGARPAANPNITFGTAPVAPRPAVVPPPATLSLDAVAPAQDGSEAVITADGSVLGTALQAGPGSPTLARVVGSTIEPVAPATPAICVSRGGHSIAYLAGTGANTSVVMADGNARNGRGVPVQIDAGSPLGWIGDDEVSFVGGGALKAVDRTGRVRTLWAGPVHAETDVISIAPGGRWVFLGSSAGQSSDPVTGQLIDLQTRSVHALTSSGGPSFSADGATVYWVDVTGATPTVATAPSAGGPVLHIPLPLAAGERITDVAVNADASLLLYTVHHQDGSAQLRLASLPSGATLATAGGGGQSPNWSPAGNEVAVLAAGRGGPQINLVKVPPSLRSTRSSVEQTASAFVNAQIANDPAALSALAAPGVNPSQLPRPARATVLATTRQSATRWQVLVRLVVDPVPTSPGQQATIETLTFDTTSGRPLVEAAAAPPLAPARAGPHLTGVAAQATTVRLTFDSDLDPASVTGAIVITGSDGRHIPVALVYDPTAKAVTATGQFGDAVRVAVTGRIKDIRGRSLTSFGALIDTTPNPS